MKKASYPAVNEILSVQILYGGSARNIKIFPEKLFSSVFQERN